MLKRNGMPIRILLAAINEVRGGWQGLFVARGPVSGHKGEPRSGHSGTLSDRRKARLAGVAAGVLGVVLLAATAMAAALDLGSRRHIVIVGSSTIYPIVTAAAEYFSRASRHHAPVVESTGTGGGFKLFCNGLGLDTPDITMASRRMLESEKEGCRKQGVDEVPELKIGYDGIAFASVKGTPALVLSTDDIYLALAREVPDPGGEQRLVANPYLRWSSIDPALPDLPIRVLGPPPTSGTRDLLAELVLERACGRIRALAYLRRTDEANFRRRCHALREDGAYVNAGENEERLVRKLLDDPGALAVLGFNFLERNADRLQAASVDGVWPDVESIRNEAYPLSRPLFLYVKQAHVSVVPGLMEFLRSLTSEGVWGDDGYLAVQGLIPMPAEERAKWSRDFFASARR